jgi:hypothetical protein
VNGIGVATCDVSTLTCEAICPSGLQWCNRGCYEFCAV